ncbi:hypothetical protein C9994_06710 [Marivirga lumbricoides]|uniref:Signal transduction histidine kinase dimerisation/phosphoacceptor domain-containing protein n=1 Tax=Marivirga lumbricoides TaxID=1046115 RepID=A0A2T4DS07_9BACT|nr:hypothetical protein C9994_06710 [Marivirga lumbricoides]
MKLKSFFFKIFQLGIEEETDAEQQRKVYLTNSLSIYLSLICLFLVINDFFFAVNTLAGYRRLIIALLLPLVPFINKAGHYKAAKSLFIIGPGFFIVGMPIILQDFFPGQLLWFHYATAIFAGLPLLIFHYKLERKLMLIFSAFYFILTIFIDKLLISFNPNKIELVNYMDSFTDYKLPPILFSLFLCVIIYRFNKINIRYEEKLSASNRALTLTNEELLSQSEQLHQLNQDLERLVKERSDIIQMKNKKIIEYANLNAHKVRGPLARILGLINISKYEHDEEELKNIIGLIDLSAYELNDIILNISEILSEEDSR